MESSDRHFDHWNILFCDNGMGKRIKNSEIMAIEREQALGEVRTPIGDGFERVSVYYDAENFCPACAAGANIQRWGSGLSGNPEVRVNYTGVPAVARIDVEGDEFERDCTICDFTNCAYRSSNKQNQ